MRRSRRIQSLSESEDDEASASVTSRRSRSSSIASSASTKPASNRRSTRATKASTTNKDEKPGTKKELEVIPETIDAIAVDTATSSEVATTPAKSAKKIKKKKDATPKQNAEKDTVVTKEPAPTSSKSKKKRKKSMDAEEEQADISNDKVMSTPKSAPKTKNESEEKSNKKDSSQSKKNTTEKTGGDNSTKKLASSPSKKKKQSNKHISPSPKRKHASQSPQSQSTAEQRPKHVIDVKVHRMRFLKLYPKSILAMASTPLDQNYSSSVDDNKMLMNPGRLAISREGGSVELVSPQDRYVSLGNVPGVRGREVDALVWVCAKQEDPTEEPMNPIAHTSDRSNFVDEKRHLFGCSRDGTIFELDFATKRQKGVIGSGGGGVFCLASMGRGSYGGLFAAGCEDGSVKIYSAFDEEGASITPQLVASLPNAGNAILSLAWVPGHGGDGGMGGSVIFAGVADGTIRRFDCSTSTKTGPISTGTVLIPMKGSTSVSYRWKSTLRMTVENRGLREATKVWTLEALSDGTLISGDSLGHFQIWDGMAGTMTQTFDHNETGADVLCLAVSEDENKIFASGIDSSVRCFQRQCSPPTSESGQNVTFDSTPVRKWISANSHRKHSHDVKALAICHKYTKNSSKPLELLVSGSVDTRICTYITKDFKSSRPKIWYNWPTLSPISVSSKQRILAVTRDSRIDLYRLGSSKMLNPNRTMHPEARDESKSLVKTITIQSHFNISCSVISDDGKFLAASDAVSLYIFSLDISEDEDGIFDILPTKLNLKGECKHPATALKFDNKGRLICATNNGPINILKISEADSDDESSHKVSLEHVFKEHTVDWSASSHHFPIATLDLSSDGKWLAAGRFSSRKGAVNVFTLPSSDEDDTGRYKHWWSVPELDAPTTCIKFLGGGSVESSLAVGCSNNEFYIYNLGRRSLSHWSNDMGLPLLKSLPKELTSRSEPVSRIISNPVAPQRFILGSHGFFCVVNLDHPVPERANMFPPDHLRAKRLRLVKDDDAMMYCPPRKKSKSNSNNNRNFTICLRYSEILFQDYIAENEMVVVEEPWKGILEELPDALARKVYGT